MTAAERTAAIRARLEAATPGPWKPVDLRHQQGGQIRIFPDRGVYLANVIGRLSNAAADAALIAHAPEDLGHLLGRVALLEAAVLRANETINALSWGGDGLARMEPDHVNALRLRNVVEAVASTLDAETLGLLGREVPPAYTAARSAGGPWRHGDELPEDRIRRLRAGDAAGSGGAGGL